MDLLVASLVSYHTSSSSLLRMETVVNPRWLGPFTRLMTLALYESFFSQCLSIHRTWSLFPPHFRTKQGAVDWTLETQDSSSFHIEHALP
ncbi:hypothetical protein CKAN_00376000 [Cinnamomum micranthum f. kanehirae]|uniref:Uncharacterized protein n=1 Tax=Cinnamomum micranthum f. kanehirae TaxID=337451 RepID=A0A443NA48_9MAGN|nr:hypothetical protein CKAN_00376000 [Cinnamomum micranthum f. kanehirae]